LHTQRDSFADGRWNIVGCYTQVGAHLTPLQAEQPERGSIIGLHWKRVMN